MKKTNFLLRTAALLFITLPLLLTGCSPSTSGGGNNNNPAGGNEGNEFASGYKVKITKDDLSKWALWIYDLSDYNDKKVDISISLEAAVENNSGKTIALSFPVNKDDYPEVANKTFAAGKTDWTKITGEKKGIELGTNNSLYLSNYNLSDLDLTIYLKNISVTVKPEGEAGNEGGSDAGEVTVNDWTQVSSLKEVYVDSGLFDHFGFATTMDEITGKKNHQDKAALMAKHGNTTSMGNEMKPQWILWNYGTKVTTNGTFTASNGKTISVPVLPASTDTEHGLSGIGTAMQIAKDKGFQMRGHVLTWHSQTFDWFFCEDYDVSKGLTDKETMTARHEWYIKTVLEYVADWEAKNNNGEHIIYTWDVVNEAVADDALGDNLLRGTTEGTSSNIPALAAGCHSEGGTSRWYQIYESDEFIVNAFRFANKYAPKDVTLCYNDYNEYYEWPEHAIKRTGILTLLKSVLSHKDDATLPTRLDAFGMQSHFADWVGLSGVEDSIKEYLKLGIDLQVTELDFAWNDTKYTDAKSKGYSGTELKDLYSDHMKLYVKYAKSKRVSEGNGITSVTLWAVEDKDNWLNDANNIYYPSLFERDSNDNLVVKDAFYAVLNAAK